MSQDRASHWASIHDSGGSQAVPVTWCLDIVSGNEADPHEHQPTRLELGACDVDSQT